MRISELHNWLGRASGGAGPVFRWVWASLIAFCAVSLVYVLTLALDA